METGTENQGQTQGSGDEVSGGPNKTLDPQKGNTRREAPEKGNYKWAELSPVKTCPQCFPFFLTCAHMRLS